MGQRTGFLCVISRFFTPLPPSFSPGSLVAGEEDMKAALAQMPIGRRRLTAITAVVAGNLHPCAADRQTAAEQAAAAAKALEEDDEASQADEVLAKRLAEADAGLALPAALAEAVQHALPQHLVKPSVVQPASPGSGSPSPSTPPPASVLTVAPAQPAHAARPLWTGPAQYMTGSTAPSKSAGARARDQADAEFGAFLQHAVAAPVVLQAQGAAASHPRHAARAATVQRAARQYGVQGGVEAKDFVPRCAPIACAVLDRAQGPWAHFPSAMDSASLPGWARQQPFGEPFPEAAWGPTVLGGASTTPASVHPLGGGGYAAFMQQPADRLRVTLEPRVGYAATGSTYEARAHKDAYKAATMLKGQYTGELFKDGSRASDAKRRAR